MSRAGRDEADLSDPAACAAAIRAHAPEAVINAAAYTGVDKAEEEEDLATTINGAAPAAMARACAELGIPFVHISTDYVFDGSGDAPARRMRRRHRSGPMAVQARRGNGCVARAGPCDPAHLLGRVGPWANFVKTMLRVGPRGVSLRVVDDQIGGPTPAADIAAPA
jgi:dTDP-4-dehydrorhamnose reductase